jgi:hypothetical protein
VYDTDEIDCKRTVLKTASANLYLVVALLIMIMYATIYIPVELSTK